ncbi:MAG: AAA family ATPase, partial [Polyangiales bacterium]
VVVDEASMVDLALMARLLDAVPSKARVILLGDRNQLASVEAGAVLGDICGAGLGEAAERAEIGRSIVVLQRSYRYAEGSGIRALADAINAGDAARALEILRDPKLPDVALCETPAKGPVPAALFDAAVRGFAPYFAAQGAEAKLAQLERFRVLCAHRRGPHGQVAVNAAIEAKLREDGLIDARAERYAGRPILVTQNDHQARLFNGDVGVLDEVADSERVVACFAGDGGLRTVAVARLPPHESVYAMSVHKSQGSELDEVAVLLPPEPSPVLSRELLYTAVTRARTRVVLYAPAEVLTLAVQTSIDRASGLRAALYGR